MKLYHLAYFCKAYELKSITKAADELFVSQPSITLAVQHLENKFKVRLFNRINQRIEPTEEGKYLYEKSKVILSSLNETEERMKDLGDNRKKITIGVPPMIGGLIFPKLYENFRILYPEIQCHTVEKPTSMLVRDLEDGKIDVCIVITNNILEKKFKINPLLKTQTIFCTYPGHKLTKYKEVDIKQISNEDVIMYKEGYYQNMIINAKLKQNKTKINIIHETSELFTMVEFIKNRFCSGFFFKEMVDINHNIVGIPFVNPIIINIGLITSLKNYVYKDTNRFIESSLDYYGR